MAYNKVQFSTITCLVGCSAEPPSVSYRVTVTANRVSRRGTSSGMKLVRQHQPAICSILPTNFIRILFDLFLLLGLFQSSGVAGMVLNIIISLCSERERPERDRGRER